MRRNKYLFLLFLVLITGIAKELTGCGNISGTYTLDKDITIDTSELLFEKIEKSNHTLLVDVDNCSSLDIQLACFKTAGSTEIDLNGHAITLVIDRNYLQQIEQNFSAEHVCEILYRFFLFDIKHDFVIKNGTIKLQVKNYSDSETNRFLFLYPFLMQDTHDQEANIPNSITMENISLVDLSPNSVKWYPPGTITNHPKPLSIYFMPHALNITLRNLVFKDVGADLYSEVVAKNLEVNNLQIIASPSKYDYSVDIPLIFDACNYNIHEITGTNVWLIITGITDLLPLPTLGPCKAQVNISSITLKKYRHSLGLYEVKGNVKNVVLSYEGIGAAVSIGDSEHLHLENISITNTQKAIGIVFENASNNVVEGVNIQGGKACLGFDLLGGKSKNNEIYLTSCNASSVVEGNSSGNKIIYKSAQGLFSTKSNPELNYIFYILLGTGVGILLLFIIGRHRKKPINN